MLLACARVGERPPSLFSFPHQRRCQMLHTTTNVERFQKRCGMHAPKHYCLHLLFPRHSFSCQTLHLPPDAGPPSTAQRRRPSGRCLGVARTTVGAGSENHASDATWKTRRAPGSARAFRSTLFAVRVRVRVRWRPLLPPFSPLCRSRPTPQSHADAPYPLTRSGGVFFESLSLLMIFHLSANAVSATHPHTPFSTAQIQKSPMPPDRLPTSHKAPSVLFAREK